MNKKSNSCPFGRKKGKPSVEFYKDGKPQYYCYGLYDRMTEELLEECRNCKKHVNKAQNDLDLWNRSKNEDKFRNQCF